jgi:hypothetical protein
MRKNLIINEILIFRFLQYYLKIINQRIQI